MNSSRQECARCRSSIFGCTSVSRHARRGNAARMNETLQPVEIVPMRAKDVDRVATLAGEIWRAHYPAMVSHAQIEYMLGERYNRQVMLDELRRGDLWWDVLLLAGKHTGFASYFLTGEPGEMK